VRSFAVGDAVTFVQAGPNLAAARRIPAWVVHVVDAEQGVVNLVHLSPHEADTAALGRGVVWVQAVPFCDDESQLAPDGTAAKLYAQHFTVAPLGD